MARNEKFFQKINESLQDLYYYIEMTKTNLIHKGNVAENRKARFNYAIEDTFDAGIVLHGSELKPMRAGKVSIQEAYATFEGDELWLINANIADYSNAVKKFAHHPTRPRKLLLKQKELKKLFGMVKIKGYSIIPLVLYFNDRGIAKLKLGLARGKKQYEKRADEKDRDWQREKGRIMKGEG